MAGMDGCGGAPPPEYTYSAGQAGATSGSGGGTADVADAGPQSFEQWSFTESQNNVSKHDKVNDALMMMVFNYDQAKKNMDEIASLGKGQA